MMPAKGLVVFGILILLLSLFVSLGQVFGYCKTSHLCPTLSLGLDLKGGTHFTLTVNDPEKDFVNKSQEEKNRLLSYAIDILRERVDQLGINEPSIQQISDNSIGVQIAGHGKEDRARKVLSQTAQLSFHFMADYEVYTTESHQVALEKISGEEYVIEKTPQIHGSHISDVRLLLTEFQSPDVQLELTPEGQRRFAQMTDAANRDRYFAVVVDGEIMSTLQVGEKVASKWVSIVFDQGPREDAMSEAKDLLLVLRSGALPFQMGIAEERTVGPSLGEDQIRKGLMALGLALVFIFGFLLLIYKKRAFLPVISLVFSLSFIVMVLSFLSGVLTLPGMAALILTAGISVDASILMLEKLKEENPEGLGLSSIVDANITTALIALILAYYGSGPIRGFGVVLLVGTVGTLLAVFLILRPTITLMRRRNYTV